jgi:hypothetical protein
MLGVLAVDGLPVSLTTGMAVTVQITATRDRAPPGSVLRYATESIRER